MAQEIAADESIAKQRWKGVAGINRAAQDNVAAIDSVVLHMREIAVRVRIVQRAMLAEILLIKAALHRVPEQSAAVRTVEQVAVRIECKPVNVAAAFGEQLHLVCNGMIAPDALLKFEISQLGGRGATV